MLGSMHFPDTDEGVTLAACVHDGILEKIICTFLIHTYLQIQSVKRFISLRT